MTIEISIPSEIEAKLKTLARKRGWSLQECAQHVILEYWALMDTEGESRHLTPQEKIRALDAIAKRNSNAPVLPPEAFEREHIYSNENGEC